MKLLLYISTVLFLASFVSAQSWQDSLKLGKQHYKEGNYERAYKTLLEAQKIAPADVNLSQDIGNAAYRKGDYKMAEEAFQSAASNEQDSGAQSKQWHNVGNSQMKEKNYQGAIDSYKNALHINPEDDKTRYNLAEAKRRVKVQEEKKKQQNQDESQKKGNPKKDDKSNPSKGSNQKKDQTKAQNQQPGSDNDESPSEPKGKLSDRKSDRMLEDLLKDEMKTKRKVRGAGTNSNQEHSKSGKRW